MPFKKADSPACKTGKVADETMKTVNSDSNQFQLLAQTLDTDTDFGG